MSKRREQKPWGMSNKTWRLWILMLRSWEAARKMKARKRKVRAKALTAKAKAQQVGWQVRATFEL